VSEDKKPKIEEKALKTEKASKTNLDNESVLKAKPDEKRLDDSAPPKAVAPIENTKKTKESGISDLKSNKSLEAQDDKVKKSSEKNEEKKSTDKSFKKNNETQTLKGKSSKEIRKDQPNENQNNSNNDSNKNTENEYIEKLVSINRVAKVVKGGRRFSFAALVVVGDGNGMVGHGKGKAKEVPEAIKKATDEAKAQMIRVPLKHGKTLHHDIKGRFDSGKVYLRSAPSGTGVIAGGPMRAVFEALGIQDIVAKSVGSSNPHNMVRATFEALKVASSPKIIALRRGLKINDITKRRKFAEGTENVKN
jgi:small subunit ribosomal protein S5